MFYRFVCTVVDLCICVVCRVRGNSTIKYIEANR